MGQPVGGGRGHQNADSTDPRANPYLQPLYPDLYPPLGHAPDGTPLFTPGQPTRTQKAAAEAAARAVESSDYPDGTTPAPDSGSDGSLASRGGLGRPLALVAIAVLVVLCAALLLSMRDDSEQTTLPDYTPTLTLEPSPEQPPFNQPTVIPGQPGTQPDQQLPGAPSDSVGKSVVYEVTLSDTGSIIYVDDTGLRTATGAPSKWTVAFTGTGNPLRVLVISGVGDAACKITVDGAVVASDSVTADSPRRTLSCRA